GRARVIRDKIYKESESESDKLSPPAFNEARSTKHASTEHLKRTPKHAPHASLFDLISENSTPEPTITTTSSSDSHVGAFHTSCSSILIEITISTITSAGFK